MMLLNTHAIAQDPTAVRQFLQLLDAALHCMEVGCDWSGYTT